MTAFSVILVQSQNILNLVNLDTSLWQLMIIIDNLNPTEFSLYMSNITHDPQKMKNTPFIVFNFYVKNL